MKQDKKIRIFEGGTAIVTGGASGIGRALGLELAKRGCEVILADLQLEAAEEIAAEIRASGGKATAAKLDVVDFPTLELLVKETVERTGRLDYIFNNAGIGIGGNVHHYSIEDWNRVIDVNFRGVTNGIQAAYPFMVEQGFGHIINTASFAGLVPGPGNVPYSATKHAVMGLSASLRSEAAAVGVRISVLCPGVIRTPILDGGGKYGKMLIEMTPEQEQAIKEMFEKYRPMEPDVFAKKALNMIAKNKAIIVLPRWYKLLWWFYRLFPSLLISLSTKPFIKMQTKLGLTPGGKKNE